MNYLRSNLLVDILESTGGFDLGIMLFGVLIFGLALMMFLLPGYRGYQRTKV